MAANAQKTKIAEQWIAHTLATEQRPVTFRELAREVGCHIHTAKNLLLHYQSSHPDVVPTYLLSGPLLATSSLGQTSLSATQEAPTTQSLAHMSATQKLRIVDMDQMSDDERNSEADAEEQKEEVELEAEAAANAAAEDVVMEEEEEVARWGVVLVKDGELDEKRGLFAEGQASVHVYALSPAPIRDPAVLLSSSVELRRHPAYRDRSYGGIWGDELVALPKGMREGAMDFGKKEVKVEKEVVKTEGAKKEEVKKETQPTLSRKESQPKLTRNDSQTKPTAKSKRRIITSDDEDDEPTGSRDSSSKPTSKLSAKTSLEPTSSMVRDADQAAMEAMMSMDVDDEEVETEEKPKVRAESKDKKRKRKQVKKSRVEMDERGYMVTKDYYTEESCSGSETETESMPAKPTSKSKSVPSAPPPKEPTRTNSSSSDTKSKPKPAPKPPAKGPKGQSTLAGFFKKV